MQLNDAQIIRVLTGANAGEVAAAEISRPRLQVMAASDYAQMMIMEHTTATQQVLALASSKQLTPQTSTVSFRLDTEAAALVVSLSATPTPNLPLVYMQSQVRMHQEVLTLIDAELLPDVQDADLRALLNTLRTAVAAHLARAQAIVATL